MIHMNLRSAILFFFFCGFQSRPVSAQAVLKYRKVASATKSYEAESSRLMGQAKKARASAASSGYLVSLTNQGDGIILKNVKAADKLEIRYSSLSVALLSVAVNNQPEQKVNLHSSGDLTNSFLNAVIDIKIPAGATLKIYLTTENSTINIDKIVIGANLNIPPDIWNLPALPVAVGPFRADWKNLSQAYKVPDWWREAKFGAWAHWDPQSMPEMGDWYSRKMYQENSAVYKFHVKTFGHPSEYGYKDIAHNWVIDRWDPDGLMSLYVEMGAKYFMAMGVHHDNFDCWNSVYQPWNSVNVGPKKDIVGIWEKTARAHKMRFGIGFHNTPARTWGQFMPIRYSGDKNGPKKGMPYDGLETIADGKGKWWEGLDPADLYGPVHSNKDDPLLSPFANQFMWRVNDAITKYHPDVIYFDEHAGDSQVDMGVHMGLGFLAPQLIANYYNKSLKWNHGKMDVVVNLKGVGGRYNSFQNSSDLLPFVDRSLVKSSEAIIEPEIMAYPFQTETSIAEWHYLTGQKYMDAATIVSLLMQNVSRNGVMLLNLPQHGRGDLDDEVIKICKDVGKWLKVNGEGVYGSRPFEVCGDSSLYYTRNKGKVYAAILHWQNVPFTLHALNTNGNTLGKVTKVELIGDNLELPFVQTELGLTITPPPSVRPLNGISDPKLATVRMLRITHDKDWLNDDDPGVTMAHGWLRHCNLNTGDFNDDLTTSDTPGATWIFSFNGKGVSVIAPRDPGAGRIEIQIDGKHGKIVDLSSSGARQSQQLVFKVDKLSSGKHNLKIINIGTGPVAIDALVVAKTDTYTSTRSNRFIHSNLP
jgi:alpha-L-fucosidase